MDTCPDCQRPLFQDLIHRCRRANEAGPGTEPGTNRNTLPAERPAVNPGANP